MRLALISICSALVAIVALFVVLDVFEKKQEARRPDFRVVELSEDDLDPETWGRNYPLQHDGYLKTVDMVRTRFGGSESFPRVPTEADPRSFVAESMIEAEPRLKTMWAGYAFAVDYREKRGHAYMLLDQTLTERQRVVTQPGTCIHCHASLVGPYRELGGGDLTRGFEACNAMPYSEARKHVENPIACTDCHDPESLALRITRPAFAEGIAALKASEGVPDYDVNTDASRAEMRSYVCGQCHVEYYFSKEDRRLIYPWAKGLRADQMLEYYDEIEFTDWTHARTGAPMLKAQHPEFELWNQGTHAQAGVACADCHMPYRRVGAQKISDHHLRSPLLDVSTSCQGCHAVAEAQLMARAERIQERNFELEDAALTAISDLIEALEAERDAGTSGARLEAAQKAQRHAQFMIDFVVSENSTGFHADQESARLLGLAIDRARRGQLGLQQAQ